MRAATLALALVVAGCDGRPTGGGAPSATVVRSADPRVATADARCTAPCGMLGQCAYDEARQRCVAASEEACAASDACTTSGLCHLSKGACLGHGVEDCEASTRCAEAGLCAYSGHPGQPCRAGTDAHCRASKACRREGRCTHRGGRCVLATDADCAVSDACREEGACHRVDEPRGPTCRATADADCAASQACTAEGRCRAIDGFCRPGAPAPASSAP